MEAGVYPAGVYSNARSMSGARVHRRSSHRVGFAADLLRPDTGDDSQGGWLVSHSISSPFAQYTCEAWRMVFGSDGAMCFERSVAGLGWSF